MNEIIYGSHNAGDVIVHDTGKWCGLCCLCSIHYTCDMI